MSAEVMLQSSIVSSVLEMLENQGIVVIRLTGVSTCMAIRVGGLPPMINVYHDHFWFGYYLITWNYFIKKRRKGFDQNLHDKFDLRCENLF